MTTPRTVHRMAIHITYFACSALGLSQQLPRSLFRHTLVQPPFLFSKPHRKSRHSFSYFRNHHAVSIYPPTLENHLVQTQIETSTHCLPSIFLPVLVFHPICFMENKDLFLFCNAPIYYRLFWRLFTAIHPSVSQSHQRESKSRP